MARPSRCTFKIVLLLSLPSHHGIRLTCLSSHNVRTSLPWKLPSGFSPHPIVLRRIQLRPASSPDPRAPNPYVQCTKRGTQIQALYRPCSQFHPRRQQDMDPLLSDQRNRSLKIGPIPTRHGRKAQTCAQILASKP